MNWSKPSSSQGMVLKLELENSLNIHFTCTVHKRSRTCFLVTFTSSEIDALIIAIYLHSLFIYLGGGNGSSQGNETEDEDHEFFDAVEEGDPSNMDDKTSFVIKVPVSVVFYNNYNSIYNKEIVWLMCSLNNIIC